MSKDAVIGVGILAASIIVIAVSLWLIFLPPLAGVDLLVLKLTGSVAVAAIFGILAWIGYTLATTPPPKPIEEIEKEIEKEMEQEKSGEASQQNTQTT
jgi:predicted DNA-binding transcriptional regulator